MMNLKISCLFIGGQQLGAAVPFLLIEGSEQKSLVVFKVALIKHLNCFQSFVESVAGYIS